MKEKKSAGSKTNRIVFIVAIIICVVAAVYVGYVLYTRYQEQKQYDKLKSKVTIEQIVKSEFTGQRDGETPDIPASVLKAGETNPIDFDKLQSYNSELIAWVRVPGTNVDYPVARHESGALNYYLNYNMYKQPAFCGCVFMQNLNKANFSDNNTVLYGHNMKALTMFGSLHYFEKASFFKKHKYMYVYTPTDVLTYEVFAAYTTDNRDLMLAYNFADKAIYKKYLTSVSNIRSMDANIRDGVKVTASDKIITLSTCTHGQTSKRYLVQGVLVRDVKK